MYKSALPPHAHQVEALNRSRGKRAFAFLMDLGTGKSKVVLDEFAELHDAGAVENLLIVAPAGCYRNWSENRGEQLSEIRKNYSSELYLKIASFLYTANRSKERDKMLDWFLRTRDVPKILIVNIEAIGRVPRARDACLRFLRSAPTMMVIDESQRIKGFDSQQTKWATWLGQFAQYRRILTGLVTPHSPLDLYGQFNFLDPSILGFTNYYSFRSRYAVLREITTREHRKAKIVVNYQREAELQKKIGRASYRVLKEQCLDLPPKVYMTRDVELTPEQDRVYSEMKGQATSMLESGHWATAQLPIVMMLRLHQILCGHIKDDAGVVRSVSSNRVGELLRALEECSGKVVIWACYDYSIREIAEAIRREYGEGSVACYWGANKSSRGEDERRWMGDSVCRFLVSTQSAGGAGNTWTAADSEVYYSSTHNLEHRLNSEDRLHRIGQTRSVTVLDLVARDTVDEKILYALRKKLDLASLVTGDNWREWVV